MSRAGPHHAQDELLVLVDDVLGGVGVLDADRGDEAVDVLDRQVDVLDLLDPRRRILVVLAERLLADVLHQLDQLDAVAEVRRQVLRRIGMGVWGRDRAQGAGPPARRARALSLRWRATTTRE